LREYETLYIVNPEISDEELENLNLNIKEVIEKNEGKVNRLDIWGKRRLAYEVKKFKYGTYVLLHYNGNSKTLNEFERNLKLMENVIRYLTVRIDHKPKAKIPPADEHFEEESFLEEEEKAMGENDEEEGKVSTSKDEEVES